MKTASEAVRTRQTQNLGDNLCLALATASKKIKRVTDVISPAEAEEVEEEYFCQQQQPKMPTTTTSDGGSALLINRLLAATMGNHHQVKVEKDEEPIDFSASSAAATKHTGTVDAATNLWLNQFLQLSSRGVTNSLQQNLLMGHQQTTPTNRAG
jgi:hypothetical protein